METDLKENSDIGRRGCTALLKAIFNYESLNSVSSSNHTCDILISHVKIPSINGEAWGGKEGAIRAKKFAILAPLGKQDVNVGLLRGVPPELLHKVLKFVQAYHEKHLMQIDHLVRCKNLLEGTNHQYSTDLLGLEELFLDEDTENLFGDEPASIPLEEMSRKQAKLEKLVKIKSLSLLTSVVKGVAVPMFFSA